MPAPKGSAKFIPAGSKFIFQMHYTPNGSVQKDLSKIGLVFADPKKVKQVMVTTRAANTGFPHSQTGRQSQSRSNHRQPAVPGAGPRLHAAHAPEREIVLV